MRIAIRLINTWEIAKLWNCKAWEVGRRPISEVSVALDFLNAKGKEQKREQLHNELEEKLKQKRLGGNAV